MTSKKLTLTIPEELYKKIKQEKQSFSYFSMQDVILEALRDKYYYQKTKKDKRGRPRKPKLEKIITKKKIFSKKGRPYPF